jgi:hypothetical protein
MMFRFKRMKKTKKQIEAEKKLPFAIFYQDGQAWIERDGATGCEPSTPEVALLWEILQQQRLGLEALQALRDNLASVTRQK